MKRMRKLAGLLLAMVMVFAMTATAFAAGNKIVINGTEGHKYEAYQIFTGTLSEDKTTLSDIVWGNGITDAGKAALGDAKNYAETVEDADAFANLLVENGYLQNAASPVVDGATYTFDNLTAGYYLVKDQAGSLAGQEDEAYTSYIVKVVGTVEMNPKSDIPTVEKKVKDINDSTTTEFTGWQDSADHDMGDDVPFQLTGTLPENYGNYTVYTYVFHDTLSAGLTFNGDAKVYVVNGETRTEVTDSFECPEAGAGPELTFACDDLKGIDNVVITKDSKIVVEYTAELNENAVLGSEGNPNVVYLEYSNNPNYDGEGDVEENETGKTPEDKVIVFTYKVVVNKVDKDQKTLPGAGFTLYKKNAAGVYVAIGEELTGEALTTFEWVGLDDGDYKLSETTTPDGYNTIDDILFSITPTHKPNELTLTELLGGDKFSGEVSTGALTATIENIAGTTLPSTGGMGTTVFYLIGGILMIGAAVLLITKKRMN